MGTHDLLVFLEPLSVFQDKTFRGELRYFVLECSIYRFVSNTANIQLKQIAHRMAVSHPLSLYTSLCTGELNAIRMQRRFICSPFYGRVCRWAMLGEIET